MQQSSIALIIPVYNPSAGWEQLLQQRFTELESTLQQQVQFCIINDGSANGYFEQAAAKLHQQIPSAIILEQKPNKGKGAALRNGVAHIQADYFIYTDVDFPYTTASTVSLIHTLVHNKTDIVIGNRNEQYYQNVNGFRTVLSKLVRFFIRHLIRIQFDDTQCGLKGFNRTGKELFLSTKINRYLFDMEFLILAARKKEISVEALTVELRKDIRFSKMPLRILLTELKNFIALLFK